MQKLDNAIIELYRRAATSLPADIEQALRTVRKKEKSNAKTALSVILENILIARDRQIPICQDTGVPVFFVKIPYGFSQIELKKKIMIATRTSTKVIPLRPNAVDILTDKNSGDNTGIGFPVIYTEEIKGNKLIVDLMLKGSGSENIGQLYKLPSAELRAERDLDGVRKCVIDAVYRAQGRGCPPYIIGVGVGASRDQVTRLAKEQLMKKLTDKNNNKILLRLEERILREINWLGIGPLGLGGNTTAIGVKIGVNHRHPASYFVEVSVACWADRRARLIWNVQNSEYRIQN
ncbi:MAG: fumarate hydratase [Nitrospirae bacterium]|nr:fumarate hydratase [Nitrospirota bacterium]